MFVHRQDSNQTLLPLIPEYAVETLTPQEMLQVEQRMDQRRERLRDKCSAFGLDVLGGWREFHGTLSGPLTHYSRLSYLQVTTRGTPRIRGNFWSTKSITLYGGCGIYSQFR